METKNNYLLRLISICTLVCLLWVQSLWTYAEAIPGSFNYTVKKGDSLWDIAQKFNTTIASLIRKNNIAIPDLLIAGSMLVIPNQIRFPGEFEKQQAIWMQWPSDVYTQGERSVTPTIINLIKTFANYTAVNVMTSSESESKEVSELLARNGYTGSNVKYLVIPHLSIWARDVGPIFVKDSRNKLSVVDFGFDNYSRNGNPYYISTEEQVDRLAAQSLGLPVTKANLISEGGAIESNGKGVLMTTESVILKRNPGMTKAMIEDEFKRVLGVKKVIWLKKGLAEDDKITSGHINEFARFADPHTILLAKVLPGDIDNSAYSKETYARLEENYNILKNSTDQDGKPFRIIRVPMPSTIYEMPDETGRKPMRSYLNYAAANGVIAMQSYWKEGRPKAVKETEDGVKAILKGVFPERDIIPIEAEDVNLWGGGFHCITQHMPF